MFNWQQLLHCLGPAVQRICRTLPGKNDTCKAAIEALEDYFAPKRNVVAERYKFRSRSQNIDESIDAYLASLKELAKTCEFGELEDEMLRDHIVEKCQCQISNALHQCFHFEKQKNPFSLLILEEISFKNCEISFKFPLRNLIKLG